MEWTLSCHPQGLCLYYQMSFRTQLKCHPHGALHLVSFPVFPQCALPSLLTTGKPLWDEREGKDILGGQGKASVLDFLSI